MYLQALDICDRNNGTKQQTILRAGGLSSCVSPYGASETRSMGREKANKQGSAGDVSLWYYLSYLHKRASPRLSETALWHHPLRQAAANRALRLYHIIAIVCLIEFLFNLFQRNRPC